MLQGINSPNWPPTSNNYLDQVIPVIPYMQYKNDDYISAFFDAYNTQAQPYIDFFTQNLLPDYTQGIVSNGFLDYIATSLFGIPRPTIQIANGSTQSGPINTYEVNQNEVNEFTSQILTITETVSDDYYRRLITWKRWRGDGFVNSIPWLKKRINRFLNGENGADAASNSQVSITITGVNSYKITIPASDAANVFISLVNSRIIDLPFQRNFTIVTQ